MKFLLAILIMGGLGYVIYAQHGKIETLQTALTQSDAQVKDLQGKLAARQEQERIARPVAPAAPNPLDQRPNGEPRPSGGSLLDRNHRGPLDR